MTKGMFPWRSIAFGALLTAAGPSTIGLPLPYATPLGGLMIATGVGLVILRPIHWALRGRHGVAAMIGRAHRRAERHSGFVSRWDRLELSSRWAMRYRWARKLRPSLFADTKGLRLLWRLWRVPVAEYAASLGKDNYGKFWVPVNSTVLRIAAARSGKSVAMASRIIEHRGPAVVTTIRKDLLLLTAQLRARRGPFYVFNPGNVGSIPSNLKWSVLAGCKDMTTAERRARQLIGENGDGDRRYWDDQARQRLTPLLYAAAWAKLPMRAVLGWVSAGGPRAAQAWVEIQEILRSTPEGAAQIENLEQFFSMVGAGDRTRLSITNSLMPALEWLGNPRLAALGDAEGDDLFDVCRDLLGLNATLYVLGAQSRITSPMTGALVAEIVYKATEYAETLPGGRLDPALLLALDELALTVPGPVPQWSKHLGGSGICMDLSIQGRSALDETFGVEGRKVIFDNSWAILVGSGCNDVQELRDYEALGKTRWIEQRNAAGKVLEDAGRIEVPVVPLGEIKELPIGRVIAFNRGPVTKLATPNAEARRDVKRAGQVQLPTETAFKAAYDVAEDESKRTATAEGVQ